MLAKYDGIKIVDVAKYSKLRWLLKHFCEVHPEICEGVQEVPEIPIPDPGPWFQLDDVLLREVNADLAKAIVQVPEFNLDRIRDLIEQTRRQRRADFSVCDVQIPARVPRNPDRERSWWSIIPFIP